MVIGDDRFELGVVVRLAETAGMRELQSDDDVVLAAGRFLVRGDCDVAQTGDVALALRGHRELFWIGAAIKAHRAGFAAPDQFGAAQAETLPTALGVFGRLAVALTVPAFHRMDRQPVADFHAVDFERLRQRRCRTVRDNIVAWHVDAERLHVVSESGDAVE